MTDAAPDGTDDAFKLMRERKRRQLRGEPVDDIDRRLSELQSGTGANKPPAQKKTPPQPEAPSRAAPEAERAMRHSVSFTPKRGEVVDRPRVPEAPLKPEPQPRPPIEAAPPKPEEPDAPRAPSPEPETEAPAAFEEVEEDHPAAPEPSKPTPPTPEPVAVTAKRGYALVPTQQEPVLGRVLSDPVLLGRALEGQVAWSLRIATVGLLLLAAHGVTYAYWGEVRLLGVPLWGYGAALILAGGICAVLLRFLPQELKQRIEFGTSQRDEWERTKKHVKVLGIARLSLLILGWVLLALAATFGLMSDVYYLPRGIAATGILGVVSLLVAFFLGRILVPMQRLYAQSLILTILEKHGISGGKDLSGLAPVLKSLDELLGKLPEAEVMAFMKTDEAKAYLDLMKQVSKA